jgi:hypothetical protein
MSFLTPGLAAIAASIAIPALLILYFLKLRRRDVEISTTLLWKKAIQDLQANAPFQKLRRNILLFLQLLILAAALMALAQPQIKGELAAANRHLIVIDRSASMSAEDASDSRGRTVSRLEAAKEQALAIIDSLREPGPFSGGTGGDQAMVITFDTSAKALQSFTHDKNLLRAAVRAIEPSDAPSSIDEAFRLVRAQAPRRLRSEVNPDTGEQQTYEHPPEPVGTVHLFSDGRLPDVDSIQPARDDVVIYHALGQPDTGNVGITSLRAGRDFDDPNQLSIFVGLQSTFSEARTVEVELRIDDAVAAIRPVQMAPASAAAPSQGGGEEGGSARQAPRPVPALNGTIFRLTRPQGGLVTVSISPGDALATDNRAYLVVPPAKKLSVAVVTRGNMFIASALESLPLAKLDVLAPEQYERARTNRQTVYDVVVLDGYLPTLGPVRGESAPLPPGRFLIFNAVPTGPMGLVDKGRRETGGMFINWSRDHPVLRGISLDAVYIARTRDVELGPDAAARVLATTDAGPGIIELSAADSRAIIVPFDVAESYWPFDVSFVVFMAQAVGVLGDDDPTLGQSIQPGGVLADRLPVDAREVRVRLPGGAQAELGLPAPDGRIVYGPIQRAGIYHLSWQGAAGPSDAQVGGRAIRPFAANLLDPYESDIGTLEQLPLVIGNVDARRADRAEATRRLWPWLLLAVLGVMLVEWWVYNRRVQL